MFRMKFNLTEFNENKTETQLTCHANVNSITMVMNIKHKNV